MAPPSMAAMTTPQLSGLCFALVREALTRAPKHPVSDTGTDYLLRALDDPPLDQWSEVRAFTASAGIRSSLTRAAGYAMAMSGGVEAPAEWKTSAERPADPSVASPVIGDLREAAWAVDLAGRRFTPWTDAFIRALERTVARADARSAELTDLSDLALALFDEPNRVTESFAYKAGGSLREKIDNAVASNGIAAVALSPERRAEIVAGIEAATLPDDGPWSPYLADLDATGVLDDPARGRGLFGSSRKKTKPLGPVVAREAVRQAVRAGEATVTAAHAIAAAHALHAQAVAAGRSWSRFDASAVPAVPATAPSDAVRPVSWPTVDQPVAAALAAVASLDEVIALLR